MASWRGLPVELKLLVIDNYIELVLVELGEPRCLCPLIDAIKDVLNISTALPSFRSEIVGYCTARKERERLSSVNALPTARLSMLRVVSDQLERHWISAYLSNRRYMCCSRENQS